MRLTAQFVACHGRTFVQTLQEKEVMCACGVHGDTGTRHVLTLLHCVLFRGLLLGEQPKVCLSSTHAPSLQLFW